MNRTFVVTVLTLALLVSAAADTVAARGYMQWTCDHGKLAVDLEGFQDKGTLSFRLWPTTIEKQVDIPAMEPQWCNAQGSCQPVKVVVRFHQLKLKKKASGTYIIDFGDGHTQSGSFKVTKKPQPGFLCE